MAVKVILLDTSILIDYYRRTDKNKSLWLSLVRDGYEFAISSITKYEIFSGATDNQLEFWNAVLKSISVIPFDESSADVAVEINNKLKLKRKQIDIADLFIAATAINNKMTISTLNRKHYERIDELEII
jgi:tRNA(fMet)-specific endonuclease VapC